MVSSGSTLASQLHPDMLKRSQTSCSLPAQIPEPFRQSLQIQGALVFKLYIGLVYMREGILGDILAAGSASENAYSWALSETAKL